MECGLAAHDIEFEQVGDRIFRTGLIVEMQVSVDDPVRIRPGKTQVEIILPYAGDGTLRMERTCIIDRKAADRNIRAMDDGKSRNITVEHEVRPLAAQSEIFDSIQIEKQPFQPGAVVGDILVFFKSQVGINIVGACRHDQFPDPVLPAILHGTAECKGRVIPNTVLLDEISE